MNANRIATLLIFVTAIFAATGCAVDTDSDSVESADSYLTADDAPGAFELFKGKDGQWYFRLKSANHEIVLASEGYTRKWNAKKGIASVENNGIDLSNYQLKEANDGRWYFNLRAKNYQVIGTSQMYSQKSNAVRGADDVRELLSRMLRHDAAINGGARFELFVGNDDQFYFNLKAANHEIVLQSEGYVAKAGALNGIESVRNNGRDDENYDILEASNGQFYFNLVAANGQIIGTSELYVSRSNAERGAETVADLLYSERVADPQ